MPRAMDRRTTPTRRGRRSIPAALTSQLVWSGPLAERAATYRQQAEVLSAIRPGDTAADLLRRIADEIEASIDEGRRHEWVTPEAYAEAVGARVDTIRLHCRQGRIAGAQKRAGGWMIHISALDSAPAAAA
jgi:hypothetical protein